MSDTAAVPSPDVAQAPMTPDASQSEAPSPAMDEKSRTPKQVIDYFQSSIAVSKAHRRQFSSEWKRNVDLRLGRIAQINTNGYPITDGDDLQTEINPDWYMTKTKTANLYSQTPEVQLTHEDTQYEEAVRPFKKALNYELGDKRANVGVPMEEVLNDVVNAAGVGAILVGYTARFADTETANMDLSGYAPEQAAIIQASPEFKMLPTKKVTSYKFYARRVSPTDLLWPAAFTGSNFNDADWVGYTGRLGWAEAKVEFNLNDSQKQKVTNSDNFQATQDDLRAQPEKAAEFAYQTVKFDEIFYWRFKVDAEEKNLKSIYRMVFVHGIDTGPVIDEPWLGQELAEGSYNLVGATKFPLQFLTLTYVTDNPVPQSDSAAARPQVNDMRRSRNQYFMNRDRSRPVRWFDVNRVDRMIQDALMRGDWQGFIPTNGPGDRAIGEIARAAYPQEDNAFDRQTQADLQAMWMLGQNQMGQFSSGEKTAAEVQSMQANFSTRIGQERALVQKFFLNVVEVLAGYMALYSDFPNLTEEERAAMMQSWNTKQVLGDLVFKVRPNSTILLDASQQIDRLTKTYNIVANSGVADTEKMIADLFELNDMDPSRYMKKPAPPEPEPAKISFAFTGKEDMQNPMVVAILVKNKQAPSPEDMSAAEKLLSAAQQGMPPQMANAPAQPVPPGPTPGEPGSLEENGLADKVASRSADMDNA